MTSFFVNYKDSHTYAFFRTLNNNESTSKEIFAGPTNEEDLVDLIPDIMKHE